MGAVKLGERKLQDSGDERVRPARQEPRPTGTLAVSGIFSLAQQMIGLRPDTASFLALRGMLAGVLLLVCGCTAPAPQKGGEWGMANGDSRTWLWQGENPAQATTQTLREEIAREWQAGGEVFGETPNTTRETRMLPVKESIKRETTTSLGAAQKDTSRELAAKFANMRPVQFLGIALLLVAGAFAYFRWWTPSVIAGGVGVGMIFLAHSIVGNETILLILALAGGAILAVFYAYNKGALDGVLPSQFDKHPTPSPER